MVLRRSAALAGSLALAATLLPDARAAAPRTGRRVVADELTALPAAGTKPLREVRTLRDAPQQPSAAWQHFAAAAGAGWRAAWDPATGVPSRIWGPGIAAPGATASPAIAEQHARRWLAEHIALFAPGAAVDDFTLVANRADGDLRVLGFAQRAGGRRVVGGQVSFRYKNDRLFLIGSEALPDVRAPQLRARLDRAQLAARATAELRRELELPAAPVTPAGDDEVVLPLVGPDTVYGYRLAARMMIDGGVDGRYLAYVDPASGAVLAVHQQNRYATGTLLYRGVDRYPARGRLNRPAHRARVTVGSAVQITAPGGTLTWSPDTAQTVTTGVTGDLVTIVNKATGGGTSSTQLTLTPGGQVVWDASGSAADDAQVVTFLATNIAKEYVRANLDPAMPKLDEALTANVNIEQSCNAFFDGKAINFFHATDKCENTGLLEDVVFHEFGHAVHVAEIIDGVGDFDGAMSEGAADFLAASITGDPGMGRGFFFTDEPLRQLDPANSEATWPRDIGEIHKTGKVFGGTFWDLRKAAIAALGEGPGVTLVNRLYLGALRRSVSIPTSLLEVLATDDDDGDLTNGTPHECLIRDAFGRHGLRTVSGVVRAPGAQSDNAAAMPIRLDLSGLSPRCQSDEIDHVSLTWQPDYGSSPPPGQARMELIGLGQYWATMPLRRDEVLHYSATITFKDGSLLTLPDNLGMPYYQLYQGKTVPLYCTNFETNPFKEGWTTSPGPWEWGTPPGSGSTDPPAAFSGSKILGMNLGGDYGAKESSHVNLPVIDVGRWSDVRLQFRRWLAVEDSHYDKAQILVNGQKAWINFTQNIGDSSAIHHIDREWAFQDVRVSGYAFGHKLRISFDLSSDEGLNLGGWHIDDLCVVANVKSVCGDGVKSPTEMCDEGLANSNEPSATCRTYCRPASCGDEILDKGEDCDEGPGGTDTCSAQCKRLDPDGPGGCCDVGAPAPGAFALAGLVGLGLFGRRRRRHRVGV